MMPLLRGALVYCCCALLFVCGCTRRTAHAFAFFAPFGCCAHQRRRWAPRAVGRLGDADSLINLCLSAPSSDKEGSYSEVRDTDVPQSSSSDGSIPRYRSRSTAQPDAEAEFAVGSAARQERLDEALRDLGFDPSTLTDDPQFRGSAALRMYNSFVLPKSKGAFATAELPQRASVIANSIAFQVREFRSHQEEWLRNHDKSLAEVDADERPRYPLTIVLDNVRSASNVGNILRLAEAARIANVILCGITPAPPNPKILKTAVGAAEYVPFVQAGSTLAAIRELKREGLAVWGIETTSESKTIWKVDMPKSGVAVVFGNEVVGVDAQVLKECDELVSLPTHGVKNSLNVATCSSVVVYEALRQWDDS